MAKEAINKPGAITEVMVNKLKPPTERQYDNYYDTVVPGLVLRVNSGGAKVWHVRYRVNGKPRTRRLKRYPILKVKEARDEARLFIGNPQKALAQTDAGSFKEVAENFLKRHVEAQGLRSRYEIERCLKAYVYPRWQDRPFREIELEHITDLLDDVEDKHGERQADVVLVIIRKMMNWYATRTKFVSPIVKGMGRYKAKDHVRARFLDNDEIRALWDCADGQFGALTKLLLLTAQRLRKVAFMKWGDLSDGTWRIPSEKREKGTVGTAGAGDTIKLPRMAFDIIGQQPRVAGNPYVFAGRGNNPANAFHDHKQVLDKKLRAKLPNMPHWVLHDLRRTARKLMTRAGIRPDVAELALGHSIKGIRAVYDDITEYRPFIEDALECVANEVDKIINPPPPKVVRFEKKRKRA
jgi:integrase